MKKVITLLIVLVLALSLFSGCQKAEFDDSANITVVAREDGSGTKSAFMEIIGLKGKGDVSGVIIGTGTAGILAEVKSNPYAIAYESLGYVTSDVKILTIDNIEATVENIKNGSYKIARPLNVVYKESTLSSDINKAYLSFLQSSEAQKIIAEKGYVSTFDNAKSYAINANLSGKISISGSTSLQPLMIGLASKFEQLQPNVTVTVSGGGSGTGYKNAEDGVSDFGMISENFNKEKAESCVSYEVAKDGIAVIVNQQNGISDLSLEQLKNIYNPEQEEMGKITTWQKVKSGK